MAVAAPVMAVPRPSWNPLRCSGTALPVNLLLMAKLIALCLLLTNQEIGRASCRERVYVLV